MFLIPTRNRPECIRELIAACEASGEVPPAAVMIDGEPYKDVDWPKNWTVHVASEHLEMIGATNELLKLHPGAEWYGFLNDRARPSGEVWWQSLVQACKGGWANCKSHGTNPVSGRIRMKDGVYDARVVEALGWFFPPFLVHFFGDDVLEEVLQENGLWRQTAVEIPEKQMQKHPRVFKGVPYWMDDMRAFKRWQASGGFGEVTARLKGAGLC